MYDTIPSSLTNQTATPKSGPSGNVQELSLSGRRLLISEEALQDEIGHWYEYCKAVVSMSAERGADCVVAMHSNATEAARTTLPARAVFRRSSWHGLNAEPNVAKRYWGIISHNVLVFRTIDRLLREAGPFDVVFAPTVTIHHIIGWRLLLAAHGNARIKRLVLLFRNNAGYYTPDSPRPKFRKISIILSALLRSFSAHLASGRVCLATDSDRLADEYESLSSMRPQVFVSPRVAPTDMAPRTQVSDTASEGHRKRIRFSCLGPARFEKGIDILQEAIKLVFARRLTVEPFFVIQWNQPLYDERGDLYVPDPMLAKDDRVCFLTQPLTSDEYREELERSDCMVLPYRRSSYFARISGVAVEGATAGIPIIYTQDTWCENFIQKAGAGLGTPDGDALALADAIEEMLRSYETLRAQAIERADASRKLHSAVDFVSQLWGPLLPDRVTVDERASASNGLPGVQQ
jgi:glycosyltransferase involved in cell wall biosynthesis